MLRIGLGNQNSGICDRIPLFGLARKLGLEFGSISIGTTRIPSLVTAGFGPAHLRIRLESPRTVSLLLQLESLWIGVSTCLLLTRAGELGSGGQHRYASPRPPPSSDHRLPPTTALLRPQQKHDPLPILVLSLRSPPAIAMAAGGLSGGGWGATGGCGVGGGWSSSGRSP
jgi:hypothetical protein